MTDIYHITHLNNLVSIIAEDCLWCDNKTIDNKLQSTEIGHQHIKERRRNWPVPISPRGTIGDYVPFYFAPRSPMLYAINKGQVTSYSGGQNEVLHLVANIECVVAEGLDFTFTDGHAIVALSQYF